MKKWFIRIGISLLVIAGYYATAAVITAKAVLPPNSGYGRIAVALVHPRYQMARPHYSLMRSILNGFSVTDACGSVGPPPCNKEISKPLGGSCPYCPNCQTGPCTIYVCVYTGFAKGFCESSYGVPPCQACEDDKDAYCIP